MKRIDILLYYKLSNYIGTWVYFDFSRNIWWKNDLTWYFPYKLFGHLMEERMKMMMTISQEIISKLPLAQIFWNVKLHLFFYCLCVAPHFQILKRKRVWMLTIVLRTIITLSYFPSYRYFNASKVIV